jgi:hypothetical protein
LSRRNARRSVGVSLLLRLGVAAIICAAVIVIEAHYALHV